MGNLVYLLRKNLGYGEQSCLLICCTHNIRVTLHSSLHKPPMYEHTVMGTEGGGGMGNADDK